MTTKVPGGMLNDAALEDLGGATLAQGDVLYYNGSNLVNLGAGTSGYFLKTQGAAANPVWAAVTDNGKILQVVNVMDGAVATGTTVLPMDDTIPQNTEGDEYMTLAITPASATNKLLIEVVFYFANSAAGNFTAALFQDTTAGALAVGFKQETANHLECISFNHYMTTGTTSATTFKVRAGNAAAGTTTFNGQSGARLLGGVLASSITIREILV
jgi:hypothetical protein